MKKEKTISLIEIKKMVRKLDPALKTTDETYKTAILLIAATQVGAHASRLALFTDVPTSLIKKVNKNLRKNKIWKGVKTFHSGWMDKETGGISFWLDVNCGLGYMNRV